MALALLAVGVASCESRAIGDAIERRDLAQFYEVPAEGADGPPGTIVRSEQLIGVPFDARAWRVLYTSTDVHGAPIVVSGVVVSPLGPAPAEGRTVLSWGHPTTGAAQKCAPSLGFDPLLNVEGLRMLLNRGYVVTYTDYAGMGVAGTDSYLIGATEGNNVLDAVRAAQGIPSAHAGEDVVLWGHSQGGQAVLFAAERAANYAPELDIRAVAVAAPAADLGALLDADIDDVSGVTIGAYAFGAFAAVYADTPGVDIADILTPQAIAGNEKMSSLCLLSENDALHELATPLIGKFLLADPTKTPPWNELLAQNSAGSVGFDAPLFVARGLNDTLVVPSETDAFVKRESDLGVEVTYERIPFATHATIAYLALTGLDSWLDRHVR